MQDDSENRHRPSGSPRSPDIESLFEPAIKRQLRTDAVQHPAALLPLAVCVMGVIYLLVLSPVFGGRLWAGILLITSGTVAAAAFVWRYTFRYTEEYTKLAGDLLDIQSQKHEQWKQAEVTRQCEALHSGFTNIGSTQGLKAIDRLADEYDQLQPVLTQSRDTDPLSIAHLPVLTGETYRRGLSVLSDALELMKTADSPGRERLLTEIADLEQEVRVTREDESQAEWLRVKEDTLTTHQHHMQMLDHLRLRADQLLYQAFRCEVALHHTRVELVAVRAGSSQTTVDSVIGALQRTIHQAKEVQEELTRMGY